MREHPLANYFRNFLGMFATALLFGCSSYPGSLSLSVADYHFNTVLPNKPAGLPFAATAVSVGAGDAYLAGIYPGFTCASMPNTSVYLRNAFGYYAATRDAAVDAANRACVENSGQYTYCIAVFVDESNVCTSELASAVADAEKFKEVRNVNQCREFGFMDGTPEMADCLLELYKIENQPQQNTVIANPTPSVNNAPNSAAGIELMNRGLQILNGVGTPSAPISRTSTCTRIGDLSGQVVTFNNIACPAGYAPTF